MIIFSLALIPVLVILVLMYFRACRNDPPV